MTRFLKIATLTIVLLAGKSGQGSAFSPSDESNRIDEISAIYDSIDFGAVEKPEFDLFYRGLSGFSQLQEAKQLSEKRIITLIDFRKSANEKRLWIIDLENKKVLYHTLVAHGRNSGDVYASKFSNKHESHQSSLGFYITGHTYFGKHGLSLKLKGQEKGINDQADARAIVMHGADYVSDSYIKKIGRLGRSFGCPAVPVEYHKEMITQISGGTCLFIYYPDQQYFSSSRFHADK